MLILKEDSSKNHSHTAWITGLEKGYVQSVSKIVMNANVKYVEF